MGHPPLPFTENMLAKLVDLGKKDLVCNFFRNREKIADSGHTIQTVFLLISSLCRRYSSFF